MVKKKHSFTKEEDELLILLVKSNKLLFDSNDAEYKNPTLKDMQWNIIAKTLRSSVPDCKSRWRSLRDLYMKKKRMEKQNGPQSCSSWEYVNQLGFLDEIYPSRTSLPKFEDVDVMHDWDTRSDEDQSLGDEISNVGSDNLVKDEVMLDEIDVILENPRKKIKAAVKGNFDKVPEASADRSSSEMALSHCYDLDKDSKRKPIKIFFDSMAETVMSFPPQLAAEAKLKVCQIITELEIRAAEIQASKPSTSENGYYSRSSGGKS